jgi:hypothetical protein
MVAAISWLMIAERVACAGSLEYAVKAAFLFNFAKFVEWPREALGPESAPLAICVLGPDPFGEDLDRVTQGRSVQGRRIEIRRLPLPIAASAIVKATGGCAILFVAPTDPAGHGALLRSLRDAPILTVGEQEDFTALGGCLRFFLVDQKVRFEINLQAVDRAHLKVSSKLLSLAQVLGRP